MKAFLYVHTAPLNKQRAESFSGVPPKMYIEHNGLYHPRFCSWLLQVEVDMHAMDISIVDTRHAWNSEEMNCGWNVL